MSVSQFKVVRLPEDSEADFRLELFTSDVRFKILVTESELRDMGGAMVEAADGNMPTADEVTEE